MVKKANYKGRKINFLKINRLVKRAGGGLEHKELHLVVDRIELEMLHMRLNEMFGTEQFLAIPVKRKVRKKVKRVVKKVVKEEKVEPPKPETVALFGCFDQEIEV